MKAVAVYSGGMDSFTMVRELILYPHQEDLRCLSFDYGQRHRKELDVARKVCEQLGIDHKIVSLQTVGSLLSGSALTDDVEVPEGHYAEENMKATVVPNRNMIMLSIATGYAVANEFDSVYTAVHAGDHEIYPDCRAEFIHAMDRVTQISNYQPVNINAPYLEVDKAGILQRGKTAGLSAWHYEDTWTCYKGKELACGKCGSCVERLEAFSSVGWEDPIEYEDRTSWKEVVGG